MAFNSISFLIFFVIVAIAYFLLPHKFQWMLLLLASCFFYMVFIPAYIFVLFLLIFVDYFAGVFIAKSKKKRRKWFLIISILANCGVLFSFKYVNFFASNITQLASFLHWNYSLPVLKIILPIGLSFHTFQSLSYVIEVYRGNQKAERHLGRYALYVLFFPQLVAGPIERPGQLLPQIRKKHLFSSTQALLGLQRMAIGFFKKTVIADRTALLVNQVYNNVTMYQGVPLLLATIAFAWQIYMDFSGYTDIALGAAQVLGFQLMENFNFPYSAGSVKEFWARWHISLSSWFRDYVYIGLGGNRVSWIKHARNIFISFLLSGLWHGANWTFIIWGLLNGVYLLLYAAVKKYVHLQVRGYKKIQQIGNILLTFFLITFSWIFFRANTLSDSVYVVQNVFAGYTKILHNLFSFHLAQMKTSVLPLGIGLGLSVKEILAVSVGIVCIEYLSLQYKKKHLSGVWGWICMLFLLLCILNFSVTQHIQFIYFQF